MQQVQPSWFVYQPTNDRQHRQHGHFMPSPSEQQIFDNHMQYQHAMPYQQPYMQHGLQHHQQPLHPEAPFHGSMTMAMASPQPRQLKPSMAFKQEPSPLQPLDTNVYRIRSSFSPSTPPLLTSESTISSPPSTVMTLPTPATGPCFDFRPYGVVEKVCEADLYAESFAAVDCSHASSPPMTPGKSLLNPAPARFT